MPERKLEDELDIKFYSVLISLPREEKKEDRTRHLITKEKIPKEIYSLVVKAIFSEINKDITNKSAMNIKAERIPKFDEKKKETKFFFIDGLKHNNLSEWDVFSENFADEYAEVTSARKAALIMICFELNGTKCSLLLRYNLDDRIKLGARDIESAKQILGSDSTKSALYPSINAFLVFNSNFVKVYQKYPPAKYFVKALGLGTKTTGLESEIDEELSVKYAEKLTLTQFLSELIRIIKQKEKEFPGVDIKKSIRLTSDAAQLNTEIKYIDKSGAIDVNDNCSIRIENEKIIVKYYNEEFVFS